MPVTDHMLLTTLPCLCHLLTLTVFSYLSLPTDCVDHLEWHRRYCVLEKDERTLYFYNDTEVCYNHGVVMRLSSLCMFHA